MESWSLTVEKRRWSGNSSVFIPVRYLRADQWGTWVLAPPLTPHLHPGGWIEHLQAAPIVGLIPDGRLFTAWFKPQGGKIDLSASNEVDLARSTIVFVDVELDIVWTAETTPRLVDQDEFDELVLPSELRASIRDEARVVARAVNSQEGAFGEPARREVEAAVAVYGDGFGIADGFAPVGAGLLPAVIASFGESGVAKWARGPDSWLMAGISGSDVTALVQVSAGSAVVVAISDSLQGTRGEDLVERAASVVSGLPTPRAR